MVGYDLRIMNALFNWATVAGDGHGSVLLARNPFKGFSIPREVSPRRPIATEGLYQAMRDAAPKVSMQFAALLVVAHETGDRGQSIRRLRSGDVDFETKTITWRGEHDKTGFEHVTPITDEAVSVLKCLCKEQGVIGDAGCFRVRRSNQAIVSEDTQQVVEGDGGRSGTRPVKGRGLHSLRRKFATELKQMPLRDLAHLGELEVR